MYIDFTVLETEFLTRAPSETSSPAKMAATKLFSMIGWFVAAALAAPLSRPNIILIVTDQV